MIVAIWRKFSRLPAGRKSASSFRFSMKCCRDMQTSYFEYLGHDWLHLPLKKKKQMIVSTCRRLRCLFICMPKINFINHFFGIGYGIGDEIIIILVFILDYFQENLMKKNFQKSKKNILGPFWTLLGIFLGKRELSVFKYSICLPSYQKSEKTTEPFLRKISNWRIDIQMDRQTNWQKDNSDFMGPSVGWGSNNGTELLQQ